jgi:hypothetical protein
MPKEVNIIDELLHLFKETNLVKKIIKGESLPKSAFKEFLKWYQSIPPTIHVTPDLILAFENYSEKSDEAFLVALECKYFPSETDEKKRRKRFRKTFREVGQPLRNLILGYDLVILWHLFAEELDDTGIKDFVGVCNEVIQGLELPILYFATKISNKKFRLYSPWDLSNYQDIIYITRSIKNFLMETKEKGRNLFFNNSKVKERRRAIKTALNIP